MSDTVKYFRTVYEIEVLSNEPLGPVTVEDISYEITDGRCSGWIRETALEEVNKERMEELLVAQGSDPDFLTPEGESNE